MRKPRRGVPAGRYVSHFAQFQRISRKLYVDGTMARRLGRYSIVSVSGGDPPPALPVPPSSGGGTGAGLIHRVTYPPCYMQAYAAADKILRLIGFRSPEGTGSRSSPPSPSSRCTSAGLSAYARRAAMACGRARRGGLLRPLSVRASSGAARRPCGNSGDRGRRRCAGTRATSRASRIARGLPWAARRCGRGSAGRRP